ncbi:MAG: NifU family protein [Terriglobia bacterium]
MGEERAFQQQIQQIEQLIARLDGAGDPSLRDAAKTLVQLVMELHGAGLDRIMEMISQAGEEGEQLMERFDHDELVRSLLLLHGLHPLDLEARVQRAVETVLPLLRSRGVEVKLLGVAEGVVRVRLDGSLNGCGAQSIKSAVEDAIYEAAPDLAGLVVESGTEAQPVAFVPLAKLLDGAATSQRGINPS